MRLTIELDFDAYDGAALDEELERTLRVVRRNASAAYATLDVVSGRQTTTIVERGRVVGRWRVQGPVFAGLSRWSAAWRSAWFSLLFLAALMLGANLLYWMNVYFRDSMAGRNAGVLGGWFILAFGSFVLCVWLVEYCYSGMLRATARPLTRTFPDRARRLYARRVLLPALLAGGSVFVGFAFGLHGVPEGQGIDFVEVEILSAITAVFVLLVAWALVVFDRRGRRPQQAAL